MTQQERADRKRLTSAEELHRRALDELQRAIDATVRDDAGARERLRIAAQREREARRALEHSPARREPADAAHGE